MVSCRRSPVGLQRFFSKLLFGVLFVSATLALSGCSKPASESMENDGTLLRPVKVAQVAAGHPDRLRRFPAVVEATQSAELTFRVGGEITELSVRPGQIVNEGHVIAKLDPTDFKLAVEQAEARADLANAQFNRSERLLAERILS